jgi:heme exporter protein C
MSVTAAKQPNWFARLAHPGQFLAWSRFLVWPLAIATVIAFAIGLWFSFYASPGDYQMGDMVRVMYIHVPNAWLSMLVYGVMACAALGTRPARRPPRSVRCSPRRRCSPARSGAARPGVPTGSGTGG